MERDCCKQNFAFYDKGKVGFVERFELPMLLQMCGYNLEDERIMQLNEFLDKKEVMSINIQTLIGTLTYLKELEL